MAAESSNDNMVFKILLVLFVMLWLGFTVAWYMTYKEIDTFRSQATSAGTKLKAAVQEKTQLQNDLNNLKDKIGHKFDTVGSKDSTEVNEVIGAMRADITKFGGNLAQATYQQTLMELRVKHDNIKQEKDRLAANNKQLAAEILTLRGQYNNQVVKHQDAVDQAEKSLNDTIDDSEAKITEVENQLDDTSKQLSDATVRADETQETLVAVTAQKDTEIRNLVKSNDFLNEKIDKIENISFDKPDGTVRWVDNSSGLVWIDLGRLDELPAKTTFSIYSKNHRGIARGNKDIKGKIEVTRILGPHLAEAKISYSELGNPISPSDVIYSPVWQSGRKEYFTLVGKIDIDNDGQDDTKLLIDLIRSSGGEVDNRVDGNGKVTGKGITIDTKFLVRCEIPDLTGLPPNTPQMEQGQKVGKEFLLLKKQARLNAIRIISLSDFLSYIGYVPKRRLLVPGSGGTRPYALKSGARSASTSEPVLGRSSSGQVSGLFNKKKTYGEKEASGQKSGAFGK